MSHPSRLYLSLLALVMLAGCATPTQPNRVGSVATVQFGVVRARDAVALDSNVGTGALVGGTLGLVTGSSSSARARNAIIGATLGAATAGVAEGNRQGIAYTVDLVNGASLRIVTDQQNIRVGDCVAIERVRDTSNIRRVADAYCDRANVQAVRSVEDSARQHATHCEAAKEELIHAQTADAVDLARRKVELLCN